MRGQERGLPLQEGVVRACEIGGAAPQLGQDGGDRVEDLAGGGAGRDGLALFEGGQCGFPALGEAAFEETLQQGGLLGVSGLPRLEAGIPVLAVVRGAGGGARRMYSSRKFCTPKFVMAEPKNMGVSRPAATASSSNSSPASRRSSRSSASAAQVSAPTRSFHVGSSGAKISEARVSCPWVLSSANSSMRSFSRS